jgi:dipeptidyl aminopeptidase/acylaminoacyl peptidase
MASTLSRCPAATLITRSDWIGDVNDPADRERLRQASPVTHADQIRAPLLLIHGTNDTRVTIGPTDAFHARLIELGKTVT